MKRHNRRSTRLENYDYSSGDAYYVTVCANNRESMFGDVRNGVMILNDIGKMVDRNWDQLPQRFPNIGLGEFITMPNHLHGIIIVGAPLVGAQNDIVGAQNERAGILLGASIRRRAFKSLTTNEYIRNVKDNNWPPFNKHIWQRNYYEHVIRNGIELNKIREYIVNNPTHWEDDEEYVGNR